MTNDAISPPSATTRRRVIAGLALASAGVAAPAIAQPQPRVRWRLASSFGRQFDAMFGSAQLLVSAVREATDGNFELQWFGPGEIVPPLAVAQGVQTGTVEMGQTPAFYYFGIDPAYAFGTGIPFGMNVRGHSAWLVNGGGNELFGEFLATQNIVGLYAGNTGVHAAGWFRREIRSSDDLRGLKIRIAGLAGQVLAAAGAVPQQIPPGDTYAALERGTIDAAKLISPIDDEKIGFVRVAPYYYWPGWNDASGGVHLFINRDKWMELPKPYQAVLRAAAAQAGEFMQTRYDAENARVLRRLIGQGAQIRFLPNDVIEALSKAAQGVYADLSAKHPQFKRLYEHYTTFGQDLYTWFQVSELSYDSMKVRQLRKS